MSAPTRDEAAQVGKKAELILETLLSEVYSQLQGPLHYTLYRLFEREKSPLIQHNFVMNPQYQYSPTLDSAVNMLKLSGIVNELGHSGRIVEIKRQAYLREQAKHLSPNEREELSLLSQKLVREYKIKRN